MKRIITLAISMMIFISCGKKLHDNMIPEDAPRLSDIQKKYKNLLVSSNDGWYIEYTPSTDKGIVSVWMKFFEDERVTIQSDLYNFSEELTSTYRVGGINRPELIFDTYSVWSVIAENMGGEFEFHLFPQENGDFILRHLFKNSDIDFVLRKATQADHENILNKTATAELLSSFENNSSAYFKNLILDNVTAFWEINVEAQTVQLVWEDNQQNVVTQTLAYSNLSNGIRFSEPWKVNGMEVTELIFGNATTNEMEVIDGGSAGNGRIEVVHIPAFPFKNAAERYINSNLNKTNQETVRFLGYTLDRNAISDSLKPYYDALTNALPTFWRIQVYNYNPVNNPRNAIALVSKNDQNANVWNYFYYQLEKMDDSHVKPTFENVNATAEFIKDHPDVQAFLNAIYPAEGVTIEPLTGQRLRVISRKNSLHYMELIVSTPTGIWSN